MKRILIFVLSLMFVLQVPVGVFAVELQQDENVVIVPRYIAANTVTSTLSIASKTATCVGSAKAINNNYTISITVKLQKQSGTAWSTVATWTGSGSGTAGARVSGTKSSLASGKYRTNVVAKFSQNGKVVETVTVNSATKAI